MAETVNIKDLAAKLQAEENKIKAELKAAEAAMKKEQTRKAAIAKIPD